MVVHKLHVQSHGIRLKEWLVESDEYNYMQLCEDVCNKFLGTAFMEREVQVKMNAYIKGGEIIIKVDNDQTMMKMFDLNTNNNDHIDLHVDIEVMMFVPPEPDNIVVISSGDEEELFDIQLDDEENERLIVQSEGVIGIEVSGNKDFYEKIEVEPVVVVNVDNNAEYSSPTDDDDPAWAVDAITTSEDNLSGSYEEDFEAENDIEGNLELEDSDGSSDGMAGKARRRLSDDEFVDPNKNMKKAPHFVNASGKKQLALHQVFKDYFEFNE
ncbi:hypothetical protein TorRG33x02_352350, partial [Trema orientale]